MEYATGILVARTVGTGCESDNGPLWFCSHECIVDAVYDGMVSSAHVTFPNMITDYTQCCMQCNKLLPEFYAPEYSE